MRSSIHFNGHPLHPILVGFPIAFFTGTLLFDVLGWYFANDNFFATAGYLEITGVISAALAAVPGIVDYFKVVPPKSSGKDRAARHGILNTIILLIFLAVWFYRRDPDAAFWIILGGELVGFVLLLFSSWMGGTLVYRNQIGVDHRYAHAGKWNEKHLKDQQGEIEITKASELKTDQMMLVHINQKRIVVGKADEGYVAFDDACTHKGASLADGVMICGTVHCPWHGSQFDCATGEVKAGPAKKQIKTYPIKETNGKLYLQL